MNRSNYNDDLDNNELNLWRGAVAQAMYGKRGQAFLKDMLAALNALPNPRLIADDLVKEGEVCAIGAVGQARNIDMSNLNPEDYHVVGDIFNIAQALVREITFENDAEWWNRVEEETPEQRYERMKRWVQSCIKEQS